MDKNQKESKIPNPIATNCPLCGNENSKLLYKRPLWVILQCKSCKLVRVQTNPNNHSEIQSAGFADEALGDRYMQEVFIKNQKFWLDYWHCQIERLEPFILTKHPRLLDIGCAMGHFMLAAREEGWDTVGVELSTKQASFARTNFNLEVFGTMIEDANFPAHSFDVITLWSVIEHVHDPKAVMTIVNKLIKPEGVVVVKTPNQDSLITLLAHWSYFFSAGRYFLPVYSDDHLYRFSEETLRRLFEVTNFKVIRIVQDDSLEVMKKRMQLYKHYNYYKLALGIVHALAKPIHKENQLLAYARPT